MPRVRPEKKARIPQKKVIFVAPEPLTDAIETYRGGGGRDRRSQWMRYAIAGIALQEHEDEQRIQELFIEGCRRLGLEPLEL